MDEPKRRRGKRHLFGVEARAQFLAHLRRSGNQKAAARAAGFDENTPAVRRKRDAEFDLACRAAEEEASRRLAGATDAFAGCDADFETLRRGAGGRVRIVATRKGKWSKRAEDLFLDILRDCGNISAAARAVGFTPSRVWQRRRQWPAFAERMETALDEAELALEFRLVTLGNDVGARAEADATVGRPSTSLGTNEVRDGLSLSERGEEEFDPDLALKFLKWREEKRRGTAKMGKAWQAPKSVQHYRESILRKIEAIRRHRQAEQVAEGWSRDEAGNMIPPGWVRADGGGGAAADEADQGQSTFSSSLPLPGGDCRAGHAPGMA